MPRAILLPALLSSAVHAASLSPCGSKAYFEITEDGGTNFAAVVRVPRWQEGAKVQLAWGANAVSWSMGKIARCLRAESSSPGASFSTRGRRAGGPGPPRRTPHLRPGFFLGAAPLFPPLSLAPF